MNANQLSCLENLAKTNTFFASLLSQYKAKGFLSEKQMACLEKAMPKTTTPTPVVQAVQQQKTQYVQSYYQQKYQNKFVPSQKVYKDDEPFDENCQ